MPKVKLDRIDRKILHDLQEQGRMTNVELASRVGISAPPCLRRVRALEEGGIIEGYHASLNASRLGYTITPKLRVWLDVFNLFDKQADDISYFYVSRLPGEPAPAWRCATPPAR